jgi:hypothetical protein
MVRAATVLHFALGGSPAERASSTTTSWPRLAASIAVQAPTGPAPTTAMEASRLMGEI